MADSAQFTVKLTDKITGPARKMRNSLKKLGGSLKNVFGRKQTKLVKQSGREFDRASKTLRSSARRLGDARGSFVRERGRLSKIAGKGIGIGSLVAGNLATQGVNAIGRVAVGAGKAVLSMAEFGESARLAFTRLAKFGAVPEKIFRNVRDLSVEFGLDLRKTTKAYQTFLALQFNPDQADTLIKLGADLRVLGNSAEDIEGVFRAISQIKAKGRLQADELLQLSERKISGKVVKEELAKKLGVSEQEVVKLQEAGKIDADTAIFAIEKAINRKLGGKTGEAGKQFAEKTIAGMRARMKAGATDVALDLTDSLAPAFNRIAGKLSKKLFKFVESKEGKKFLKDLGTDIEKIGIAMEKALPLAEAFTGSFGKGFSETITTITAAFDPLIKTLGGTDAKTSERIVRGIGKGLGEIVAFGLAVSGVFLLIAGSSLIFASVMKDALFGAIKSIGVSLSQAIFEISDWWANFSTAWNNEGRGVSRRLMEGLALGIKTFSTLPINAGVGAAKAIAKAFGDALGIKSPSKVFAEMGMQSAEGFAIGMASGMADPMNMTLSPEVNQMAAAAGLSTPNIDSGGGGGFSIGDISINVEVGGASISDSPHEQGSIIATQVRREVEDLIDDLLERSGGTQ